MSAGSIAPASESSRYRKVRLTVMLRNSGERTIREYDMHLDFDLPPDWVVVHRDDFQPRGGFSAVAEARPANCRKHRSSQPTLTGT
jgi:hypothetical protein